MKKILTILFLFTLTYCASAQYYEEILIDSLQRIVAHPATKDAERIDPLAHLSRLYMSRGDSAIAENLLAQARRLATQEKDSKYMIYVYNQELMNFLNAYPRKITRAFQIIDSVYIAINNTSNLEARAMGYAYIGETKYKISPEYDFEDFFKALSLAEQLPEQAAKKYRIMYSVYYHLHIRYNLTDTTNAKKYLTLLQEAAKNSGDKNYICVAMCTNLFFDKLYSANDKKLLAREFTALEKFISENRNKIQPSDYGIAVSTLLTVYPLIPNVSYIKKIDEHREILREMGRKSFNNQYTFLTVEIFYMYYKKNYAEAIHLLWQKIELDEVIHPNLLFTSYKDLATIYFKAEQYKESAEAMKKSLDYQQQYQTAKMNEQYQLAEVKFGVEKQNLQIEEQRSKMIILSLTAIGIIVVLIFLILLLNRRRKINRLEKEKADLLTKQAMENSLRLEKDFIINTTELNRKNLLINNAKDMDKEQFEKVMRNEQKNLKLIEYTKLFREISSHFYKLLQQHASPHNLSSNDLKYCAYISLRMNNKELANIMNVKYATVLSQKYRLKKKFHLSENDDLEAFICSIPSSL